MNRQEIDEALELEGLDFKEMGSRMNYGLIGVIWKGNDRLVTVFPKCFYVADRSFALNSFTLKLIEAIQVEYKELTRDKDGRIITRQEVL